MLLQILEHLRLNLRLLVDFVHARLDGLELIVALVLEDLALGLQIGEGHVDLFEDVQFAVSLKNRLFQVLDLLVDLDIVLLNLVDAVLVGHKPIDYRVDQLLDQMPSLGLNVEPEQLKRGVFSREALEVRRNQTAIRKVLLPVRYLSHIKGHSLGTEQLHAGWWN